MNFIVLLLMLINSAFSNVTQPIVINETVNGIHTMAEIPTNYQPLKKNKYVIVFHGAGGAIVDFWNNPLHKSMIDSFVNAGYIVIGSDYSNILNWGNPDSVKQTQDLISYYRQVFKLEDQPYVYMSSMGGATALNAMAHGVIKPKAVIGEFPVMNLSNMYMTNFKSQIDTAYGIGSANSYSSATKGYDPVNDNEGSVFATIPFKIWSSYSDTVVVRTQNADMFAQKVNTAGGNVQIVTSTGDHGDASNFDPQTATDFFNKY